LPNDLGKILAMKKSPQTDLNKAKFLFRKRFFTCFSKIFKKFYLLFYVKKTIKECPVPLDISIKSNRKHPKTVLVNLTKTWLGNFLGDFSLSLGNFFTKTSGHPDRDLFYWPNHTGATRLSKQEEYSKN
jgi:hypothetical protein